MSSVRISSISTFALAIAVSSGVGCSGQKEQTGAVGTTTLTAASASASPGGEPPAVPTVPRGAVPPSDLPSLPKGEGLPPVSLDGTSRPWPPPVPESVPRIAAIAIETPVFSQPDASSPRLGMLRAGAILEMDPKPISGRGCGATFRAIKPMGFVCVGTMTLDLNHPFVRASTRRADTTQKLPYMYGMAVRGGPVYASLPSAKELAEYEPNLATHLDRWKKDTVNGATYGNELWGKWKSEPIPPALEAMEQKLTDKELPWFLQNGGKTPNLANAMVVLSRAGDFSRHNGIAFVDSMLWEGRRYNLSVDLRLYAADRFRAIRGSEFHGFRIPEEVQIPFAIVKSKKAKILHEESNGRLVAGDAAEWRSTLQITGKQRVQKGKHYDQLQDGSWIADDEVARVDIAKKMPGWAVEGEKWIDINVTRQVLVAYEGTKPVYATLVSTGEAGLDDPKTTKATKRGIFRVHTKFLTATMDSQAVGEEFELRDVPYVQYFTEGYALHAAYWHDVFGQPKSHGCVNLAPEDARRLFFWTEPRVPDQWHGALAGSKGKGGTVIFVHP